MEQWKKREKQKQKEDSTQYAASGLISRCTRKI